MTQTISIASAAVAALVLGPMVAHAAPVADTDYDGDGRADIAFHRPDGTWGSVPVLRSNGDGSWSGYNSGAPSWANQPGAVAVAGDYNGDGRTDVAFHLPGGGWNTVPMLLSVSGGWAAKNHGAPSWANQTDAVAIPGDYNGDGRTDIAFHLPGGTWNTVPVLLSNGNGSWTAKNSAAPSWANQPGVVAIPGDYSGDKRTDIAFHRPGSTWASVPVLRSNGNGTWAASNHAVPSWANQPGVVAIGGDFDDDGRDDIAFHRPGGGWGSVPMLRSNGNGSFTASNYAVPSWASQPGAIAIGGDFNGDGRHDIAFHRPDGVWNSVPVLLSLGNGAFSAKNYATPSWANQPGVIALAGDYDGNGRTDIAFHRPDGAWNSVPMLLAKGNGSWAAKNYLADSWANAAGAVAIAMGGRRPTLAHPEAIADGGDDAYDQDEAEQSAWHDTLEGYLNFLRLFVRIVLGYDEYVRQSGLNGQYDGVLSNGHSEAEAFLELEHDGSDVHGRLIIKQPTLRLDGGICSDVMVPVSILPVNATSNGLYQANGASSRSVDIVGLFSGTVDIDFDFALETYSYTILTGDLHLDVPWPCANQDLTFRFERRPLL